VNTSWRNTTRSPEAVSRGHCSVRGRDHVLNCHFFEVCYSAQAVGASASHEISHMRIRYSDLFSLSTFLEPLACWTDLDNCEFLCSRPIFRAARMRKTPSRGPEFRSLRTGMLAAQAKGIKDLQLVNHMWHGAFPTCIFLRPQRVLFQCGIVFWLPFEDSQRCGSLLSASAVSAGWWRSDYFLRCSFKWSP